MGVTTKKKKGHQNFLEIKRGIFGPNVQ